MAINILILEKWPPMKLKEMFYDDPYLLYMVINVPFLYKSGTYQLAVLFDSCQYRLEVKNEDV